MKLVTVISDYDKLSKLEDVFTREGTNFRFSFSGFGSAESAVLELLGLGENRKIVLMGIAHDDGVRRIYRRLERDLNFLRAGTGIAFSIPLQSASRAVLKMTAHSKNTEAKTMADPLWELVVVISDRGTFETVKKAADLAGARGGTLIHGLGTRAKEAEKFLGINLQPEKDIFLIVCPAEQSKRIMGTILEEVGLAKEGGGICFSVPVDSALGLSVNAAEPPLAEEELTYGD
ncbi:MAG: P-II family nitrogen regulator [Gracilibacteraceae bacterium]|jgi:nitrogen regulatory protein PII|nr:P-II family nitrogen regulator [Gracilibacteraceae bacterium]